MESRRFLFLLLGSTGGLVSGWLFCTIMLPVLPCSLATLTSRWGHPFGGHPLGPLDGQVTNYRFRKSMGWEIKPSLLYQAYVKHSVLPDWNLGLPQPTERYHRQPGNGHPAPRSQPSPVTSSTAGRAAWSVLCCLNAFPRQPSSTRRTGNWQKRGWTGWESSIFFELKWEWILDTNISRANHAGVRSHIIINYRSLLQDLHDLFGAMLADL